MKLHNRETHVDRRLHMGCGETLDPERRAWLRVAGCKRPGAGKTGTAARRGKPEQTG